MRIFFLIITLFFSTNNVNLYSQNSNNTLLKNKLIELIDQTVAAQRYWLTLKHAPLQRIWSRTPTDWLFVSWKKEIPFRLTALETTQIKLAELLACYGNHTCDEIKMTLQEAQTVLDKHGVPHHISRNWLTYTTTGITICAGIYALQTYLQSKQLISIPGTSDQFKAIHEKLHESLRVADASHYNNTNLIFINTTDRELAKTILQNPKIFNLDSAAYTLKTPQTLDLIANFYDMNGNNVATNFWITHVTEPLQKIWKGFKESSAPDIRIAQKTPIELKKEIQDIFKAALNENGYYNAVFTAEEIRTKQPNECRSMSEMLELMVKIITITFNNGEIIKNEIGEAFVVLAIPSLIKGSKNYKTPAWIRAMWINVRTTKEQLSRATEDLEKGLKTNGALAMMAPAALAVYALHTLYKSAARSFSSIKITKPFKQDLVACERLLNQQRSNQECSLFYQGMLLYWITKLEQYQSGIPNNYQVRFEQDIQDLHSSHMNLEQKYQTLHAMMRDYVFLL